MDEQIKQIAERLQGLREVLELTAKDIARDCDISEEEYQSLVDAYENFVKENGVRYGFVAKVLLPKC